MNTPVDIRSGPDARPGLLAVARCLALDSLAAGTAALFAAAGIPCLLLKGPATGARLLGDRRDQRLYTDVDLLVAPDQFAAAELLLAGNGYHPRWVGLRQSEMVWHERPWRSPSDDLTVDLHRGFAGVRNAAAFWAAVWAGRERLLVAGGVLAVPGPAAAALIVALHAANPGISRQKPLDDLFRARAAFGAPVWAAAAELARRVDAEATCRAGLELLPDGAAFADQLGLTLRVAASDRMTGRHSSELSVSLAKVLEMSSAAQLTAYIGRKLLPSPALLRLRDRGVGGGPLALVRGYLRRWTGAAAGSRVAFLELREARRNAGRVRRRQRYRADIAGAASIIASPGATRTLIWSMRMVRSVRLQLPQRPFGAVVLSAPPTSDVLSRSAMNAGLRLRRATCLEQALLRQRFDAANGVQRTLIIGVTRPGNEFRAHSWLEGERQHDSSLHEIVRLPAPGEWIGDRQR